MKLGNLLTCEAVAFVQVGHLLGVAGVVRRGHSLHGMGALSP